MQETEHYFLGFVVPYIPAAFVRQSDFKNPGIFCFWNCWDRRNCFKECEILGFWNPEVNSRNPESR